MAHLNLSATGNSITVQIDQNDWSNFQVNQNNLIPGNSITVQSTANFMGNFQSGTAAYPWAFMTFVSNNELWIAVVQFTNMVGYCQVSGSVVYAGNGVQLDTSSLIASLQATEPNASMPFTVYQAGGASQPFNANGLSGSFSATPSSS